VLSVPEMDEMREAMEKASKSFLFEKRKPFCDDLERIVWSEIEREARLAMVQS